MNKICIITVYFGNLPNYFKHWLESVKWNPEIDFMMVTDCEVADAPKNLKVIKSSLEELREKICEIFGLEVALYNPYKLCDLKVFYGKIFAEDIREYDYWGHCDLDMVFGNLMYFFKKYEYEKYDKFLPLGHLSIYKNAIHVNEAYKLPGSKNDYITVLTNKENMYFDEWDGLLRIYKNNPQLSFFDERLFADISHKHKRLKLPSIDVSRKNYKHQIFYWDNGRTYRAYYYDKKIHKEEFVYIHYQKRKFFVSAEPGNKFLISDSFINYDEEINLDTIKKYNRYRGFFIELSEEILYKIKHYFKKIKNKLFKLK